MSGSQKISNTQLTPMKTSADRILTTHVGSMPRSQEVVDLLFAQDRDEEYDQSIFYDVMRNAVENIAEKQVDADVYVFSEGLTPEQIEAALFIPTDDIESTIGNLLSQYGPEPRICVMPEGPMTIPYLS